MKRRSGETIQLVIFLINVEQHPDAAGTHVPDD
jgi:hypothetical protein